MSDCKSCNESTYDEVSLPTATNTVEVVTPTEEATCVTTKTVVKKVSCSTIKDECHNCEADPVPYPKLTLSKTFAMPACGDANAVDVLFEEDISNFIPGIIVYAEDASGAVVRLKVLKVVPNNMLVLTNQCLSTCASTKSVGEAITAGTLFTFGIPQCSASTSGSTDSDTCLVGTFFFPAPGASSPANVNDAYSFALGGLYSLGGFIWKLNSRINATQVSLLNPAPGNGSVTGGYVDGGLDGSCVYPITPISEADECEDDSATAVALTGCTTVGKRKLGGSANCGLVVYDTTSGNFSVKHLLGGSSTTGPHYIQWDATTPCNSKLVSAPDLAGSGCTTTSCALYLTPANASNEYEIEVASTSLFTTTAPNNIVTLGGRQFIVTAIVTGGTPGKIRIRPRFTVTASETIAASSNICVVEGCQPFPVTDYPLACDLETYGEKVFCSEDGLRTIPRPHSVASTTSFELGADIDIQAVNLYERAVQTVTIQNPSACYTAEVSFVLESQNVLTLDDDGDWRLTQLLDVSNVAITPVTVLTTRRARGYNGQAIFNEQLVSIGSFQIAAGATVVISFRNRVETLTGSANANVQWGEVSGRLTYHLTTT